MARAGEIDAAELCVEAAYALSGLTHDPRALVQSCRRLLEFHPDCGPLWWVCAHMLEASDLRLCANELVTQLEGDASGEELFALPATDAVIVAQCSRQIVRALCERLDIGVRLVGRPNMVRSYLRYFSDSIVGAQGFLVDEIDEALDRASAVVVEVLAAGEGKYLFDEVGRALVEQARKSEIAIYLLAGVGRILPPELFHVMCARQTRSLKNDVEWSTEQDDRQRAGLPPLGGEHSDQDGSNDKGQLVVGDFPHLLITERGVRTPAVVFHDNRAVSHQRCPVPSELLVPFGVAG